MVTKPAKTIRSFLGHIEIIISMDHLNAYLSLFPNKNQNQKFTMEEIMSMLLEEGIIHGVDKESIHSSVLRINRSKKPILNISIALGTPMRPEQDASIHYHFCTDTKIHLKEDERGRINYQELGRIHTVEKGALIAEKIPSEKGIAGLNIYGEAINPGVPKDTHIVGGKNVEISSDGRQCTALCSGQVFLKNRMVHVSPIFKVDQDVDLNVGNIRFNGAVLIHGNVLAGFSVEATGDITVMGVIEGSTINCDGQLTVKGGIKGSDKCFIFCRQDFITSFIEGATVECQGNLFVDSAIVNSNVRCYSKIKMGSTKGHIVGGNILGVQGVECQETGSKLGVLTTLVIGDKSLVKERMRSISTQLSDQNEVLQKLNHGMLKHKRLFDSIKSLPEEKQVSLRQILSSHELVNKKVKELDLALEKLQSLYQFRCLATFKVFKEVYPNTSIQIGHSHIVIKTKMTACEFKENHVDRVIEINSLGRNH